jgi:hypothetical protein
MNFRAGKSRGENQLSVVVFLKRQTAGSGKEGVDIDVSDHEPEEIPVIDCSVTVFVVIFARGQLNELVKRLLV